MCECLSVNSVMTPNELRSDHAIRYILHNHVPTYCTYSLYEIYVSGIKEPLWPHLTVLSNNGRKSIN